MTSDYEPTTEGVRHAYWSHVSYERMLRVQPPGEPLEEFDLWLDRVKAEALRRVANDYAESGREQSFGVTSVLTFLYARADRIEKGEGNG